MNSKPTTQIDIKRKLKTRNGQIVSDPILRANLITGTIQTGLNKVRQFWTLDGEFDPVNGTTEMDLVYDEPEPEAQAEQTCNPTPCCGYVSRREYPVFYNPGNKVVQCHSCGQVYEPANRPPQAFDGDRIENCVRLIASMDQRITRIEGAIEYGVLKGILK